MLQSTTDGFSMHSRGRVSWLLELVIHAELIFQQGRDLKKKRLNVWKLNVVCPSAYMCSFKKVQWPMLHKVVNSAEFFDFLSDASGQVTSGMIEPLRSLFFKAYFEHKIFEAL